MPAGGPFIGAIRALRVQRVKVPRSDQTSISVGGPRLPTQALGGNGWVLPRSIGRANRAAAPVTSAVPSTRSPRDRKNVRRRQVIAPQSCQRALPTNRTPARRSPWCSTRKSWKLKPRILRQLAESLQVLSVWPQSAASNQRRGIWPAREPRVARGQLDLWREFSTRSFARLGKFIDLSVQAHLLLAQWCLAQASMTLIAEIARGASSEAAIPQ